MNLKKSPFAIQDKKERDLDNAKDYPTISDLMREQEVSNHVENTVHHRRDLDFLDNLWIIASYEFLKITIFKSKENRKKMDFIKVIPRRVQA